MAELVEAEAGRSGQPQSGQADADLVARLDEAIRAARAQYDSLRTTLRRIVEF